jgi:hypothetical protein
MLAVCAASLRSEVRLVASSVLEYALCSSPVGFDGCLNTSEVLPL